MPITIRVSKRKLRAWKMLLTGAAILAGALLLGGRVRPAITSVFTYQAQLAATRSVNDAVLDVIGRGGVDYQSSIHVREDAQGRVTFLETFEFGCAKRRPNTDRHIAWRTVPFGTRAGRDVPGHSAGICKNGFL